MPKLKTHRGAAKRFRVTGSGKIIRERAYKGHILTKKNATRKRRLGRKDEVDISNRKNIRRLIGR